MNNSKDDTLNSFLDRSEKKIKTFKYSVTDKQWNELVGFYNYLTFWVNGYQQLLYYLRERQNLVELHRTGIPITLYIHDKYHEATAEVISQYRTFFEHSKQLLNAFVVLLGHIIADHEFNRVKTSSFGKCINSFSNVSEFNNKCLNKLKALFTKVGKLIDNTICEYRDKHVEHAKLLGVGVARTFGDSMVLIHDKDETPPMLYPIEKVKGVSRMSIFIDYIGIQSTNGGTDYIYHIKSNKNKGDSVRTGECIGPAYVDSSGIHFEEYGKHYHEFSSESRKVLYPVASPIHKGTTSPKSDDSFDIMCCFIEECLGILSEYVKSSSDKE